MEEKENGAKRVTVALLKSVVYILVWFLTSFLVSMIFSFVITFLYYDQGEQVVQNMLLSLSTEITLVADLCAIAVILLFYFIRRKSCPVSKKINFYPTSKFVIIGSVLLGLGIQIATILVVSFLPIPESWFETQGEVYSDVNQNLFSFITVLTVVVIAPIVEELVFRGLVLGRLSKVMPKWVAILLSAAAFGAVHSGPFAMTYAFALGIVLGFVFVKFDSIVPTVIIHAFYNLTSLLLNMASNLLWLQTIIIFLGLAAFGGGIAIFVNQPSVKHDSSAIENMTETL